MEDLNCVVCRDTLVDPIAFSCCGAAACLWCLDRGQALGKQANVRQCPNCRAFCKAYVISRALACAVKLQHPDIDQQREQRRLAIVQVENLKEKIDLYRHSTRVELLRQVAQIFLKEAQKPMASQVVQSHLDAKLAEVGMPKLMDGELQVIIQQVNAKQQGDMIFPKSKKAETYFWENSLWKELEQTLVTKWARSRGLPLADYLQHSTHASYLALPVLPPLTMQQVDNLIGTFVESLNLQAQEKKDDDESSASDSSSSDSSSSSDTSSSGY